jgi:hypothetical protein
MTFTLSLEAIADNVADHVVQIKRGRAPNRGLPPRLQHLLYVPTRQPWVAEVSRDEASGKVRRVFLRGQKDFSRANSVGSRGVYLYFHLHEGVTYEVRELTSWTRERRYFCRVENGRIAEIAAGAHV